MRILRRTVMVSAVAGLLRVGCSGEVKQDIGALLSGEFEQKMISAGRNRPQIRLSQSNLLDILVLLHHEVPAVQIRAHFQWSEEDSQERIRTLQENEFIRRDASGVYRPTSMVITLEDGQALRALARQVAGPVSALVASRVDEVRQKVGQIEAFKDHPFQDLSLLILSNVLLDNWQINRVESDFLGAPRTPRHGMNYYHSIQQKGSEDVEAFGIFGNQTMAYDQGRIQIGIYGNRRRSGVNLQTAGSDDFARLFGTPADANANATRAKLAAVLMDLHRDPSLKVAEPIKEGFRRLGLMEGDRVAAPVLKLADYRALTEVAAIVGADLVALLEANRGKIEQAYRSSIYAKEITFAEYMIWWYHFLYSEATELLARQGHIKMPQSQITTYLMDGRP